MVWGIPVNYLIRPERPPMTRQPIPNAAHEKTRWDIVAMAILAGVMCGVQIGKVPPTLPILRIELGMDLVTAGWVASLITVCGATFGTIAGLLIDRTGPRRLIGVCLAIVSIGGGIGALANSEMMMLFSRFVEGVGLLGTAVAAPAIIRSACVTSDRNLALGLWGAYLPAGMAIGILTAPSALEAAGWRGYWWINAGFTASFAIFLALRVTPRNWPVSAILKGKRKHTPAIQILKRPGPWLYAVCFSFYALMYFAITIWLPTYLIEVGGWSLAEASIGGATVVIANVLGNITAAGFMHHGIERWKLLVASYVAYIVGSWFVFAAMAPDAGRLPVAVILIAVGGLLPAACMAGGAAHARNPSEVATLSGVVVQGANAGSLLGAPVMAIAVDLLGGWEHGYWVMVVFGTMGIALTALLLRPTERTLT